MRKLLFLVLLAGCAQQPQQPTEQQLAVLAYYADLCQKQGVDVNNPQLLKGCIWATYQRDVAISSGPNVFSASGQALLQSVPQQCATRPDYAGGFVTSCP